MIGEGGQRPETTGEVVAEGKCVVVSFEYKTGRKCPIPRAVRSGIRELEGRDLTPGEAG
jgi:acyl-CoA thioesterase FadM